MFDMDEKYDKLIPGCWMMCRLLGRLLLMERRLRLRRRLWRERRGCREDEDGGWS